MLRALTRSPYRALLFRSQQRWNSSIPPQPSNDKEEAKKNLDPLNPNVLKEQFTSFQSTPTHKQSPDIEQIKSRLSELSIVAAARLRDRADEFSSTAKTVFSQLGAELNKVTGYEEIEALKRSVFAQGARSC